MHNINNNIGFHLLLQKQVIANKCKQYYIIVQCISSAFFYFSPFPKAYLTKKCYLTGHYSCSKASKPVILKQWVGTQKWVTKKYSVQENIFQMLLNNKQNINKKTLEHQNITYYSKK